MQRHHQLGAFDRPPPARRWSRLKTLNVVTSNSGEHEKASAQSR